MPTAIGNWELEGSTTAIIGFWRLVCNQHETVVLSEMALADMIKEYEEERRSILIARATAQNLGWCNLCYKVQHLSRLQLVRHYGSLMTVCDTTCCQERYEDYAVMQDKRGLWIYKSCTPIRLEKVAVTVIGRNFPYDPPIPEILEKTFDLPPRIYFNKGAFKPGKLEMER